MSTVLPPCPPISWPALRVIHLPAAAHNPALCITMAPLPHLGDDLEDLVNLLLKVHVQQAVCLVQHQVAQALRGRGGQG